MKKIQFAVLLPALAILLSSCASPQQETRFREASAADVVLRFSSWEYTFMSKPFYAEDGFMQQIKRDNIGDVLDKLRAQREMAVVVVGWQYNDGQLNQLVSEWKNILSGCGFDRVVILRATRTSQLNGSVIVEDARLPIRTAQTTSPTAPRTGW